MNGVSSEERRCACMRDGTGAAVLQLIRCGGPDDSVLFALFFEFVRVMIGLAPPATGPKFTARDPMTHLWFEAVRVPDLVRAMMRAGHTESTVATVVAKCVLEASEALARNSEEIRALLREAETLGMWKL